LNKWQIIASVFVEHQRNMKKSSSFLSGNYLNRVILYAFLVFTSILLILLITRHYEYDNHYHQHHEIQSFPSTATSNSAFTISQLSSNQPQTITPLQKQPTIAYIFAGSARSFVCPKVHWSIRLNAIDAFGGDPTVFVRISLEDNANTRTGDGKIFKPKYANDPKTDIEETLKILNPSIIEWFTLENQESEMKKHFPSFDHQIFRTFDQRRYSMFYHRSMGYRLVLKYESEHNMKFDWVVLIRLDTGWTGPVYPITSYTPDRVWLTETGYVAYNDQFMLVPRRFSDYMFDLNTKITKDVYCLGGPDVETKWKCSATELRKKGYSNEIINKTLSFCCSDIGGLNVLGFSETIHYRHFLYGKIPVGFGRFLVYITRYNGLNVCNPDCDRLMYNFKTFAFDVLTKKYPYFAPFTSLDTRATALSLSDTGICYALVHTTSSWNPISVADYHRFSKKNRNSYPPLDYTKPLRPQILKISTLSSTLEPMMLHQNDFQMWKIHPTPNVDGCLTYDYTQAPKLAPITRFTWEDCHDHLKRKGGFRDHPYQSYVISLLPHKPILSLSSSQQSDLFSPSSTSSLQLLDPFTRLYYDTTSRSYLNATRIQFVRRDNMSYMWDGKIDCFTTVYSQELKIPSRIVMKPCQGTNMKDGDINQWFEIIGEGPGSHPLTTVAKIRTKADPSFCICRGGEEIERDQKLFIPDKELRLRECDETNPQTMYFEFELIQP
jgi:hypothetical protein